MALSPGDTLGPFEILAALGAGGMGDVYKARDTRLNREVAIKTTRAEFSGRFQREARAVAALNHANICALHDVGPDYLVMELLSGETLSSLLRNGPLPMDTVLRYGAQIAAALAAAHAKGITHRDLKPANIMVTKEGIKVLDFGLAKFGSMQSEDAHALPAEAQPTATAPLTSAHIVMGTPGYMAPEQLQGLTCDARTDIFALGLVLFVGTRENSALWRVASTGNAPPKPVSLVGEGAAGQAVSRHGDRLVFSRYDREFDLWSLPLDPNGKASGPAVRAFNSTKSELNPHFSPDGTRVALASNRSGNDEVWVCLSDGTNCSQLTNFGGPQVGTPRWSPDGNWIAFDLFQGGPSIQVVSSGGGKPRRVTNGLLPRWSMDGRWIYAWCLPEQGTCRTRVEGGRPEKLLDAISAIDISPDGVWLYYVPNDGETLATVNRMPVAGGKSEAIVRGVARGQNFVVTTSGIWSLTPNSAEGSLLQFFDFATKSTRTVYRAIRPVYSGFAISPDQSRILFSQIEREEDHDLVIAEPFK